MKILHGTWVPQAEDTFIQSGQFCLWAETSEPETSEPSRSKASKPGDRFPHHLARSALATLLEELGIKPASSRSIEAGIRPHRFWLPTADDLPLPSLELSRYLEQDPPETFDYQLWDVDGYALPAGRSLSVLNELHFIALYNLAEVQLGADLLFWYYYTQSLKQVLQRDQYIPAMRYRELPPAKSNARSKRSTAAQKRTKAKAELPNFEIYPTWDLIGDRYETELQTYVDYMPLICAAGFEKSTAAPPEKTPDFYDRETLLRHFSECFLAELISQTGFPQTFRKKTEGSLLEHCIFADLDKPWTSPEWKEQYQQWQTWRDRITRSQTAIPFHIYFHLQDPEQPEGDWFIQFEVAPKDDPSLRLPLADIWRLRGKKGKELRKQLGDSFEQHLLMNLGYAARIYPLFWKGLETDEPVGIAVNLQTAFDFLKDAAWVLEDAGYKVVVPAWWTPKGRQRAKVKLRAQGSSSSGSSQTKSYFSYDTLVKYQYEFAIGDQSVSQQEWQQLVAAKSPLVQFRGQWMELDPDKMQQMLEFWQKQQAENPELSLLDFMKLTADEENIDVEYDRDDVLSTMLTQLNDKSHLEQMPDPAALQGTLRDYQKRGLSWLHYLDNLGLNGCLADDMGLGKTIQVIARLVQEREQAAEAGIEYLPPTLLIAPTSVLGNWQRELEQFAPQLRATIHHGSERVVEPEDFEAIALKRDVVITSFTLARKDAELLSNLTWHRIVLDEAQNIKNPKTAQTKAILKLEANHRLALTGTPVENRLMDLWSIFNFLNPGYLGKQAQFRKNFELPIQRDNQPTQSATLKKLVEPFILRRVKTDKSIIKDLPDKVEQKLYCNLTKEQASLYEAVIQDVGKDLDAAEGMKRKGLILATLTKLKQICNHPRQFLQDESEFSVERSHKLSRLTEMLSEVIEENESALIFTQYREIGEALTQHLKHNSHYNTYYIHGGTNREKREQMIAEFQDPETEPSIFVLSLKAAGVGITLTKANHVFHFDRWWNPAVEDQATDRAFRIGQDKNVFVHKFVAIGTLEERIDKMIEDKKKLAGSIVGSDESWLTELDNESFKQLISLNLSAVLD
ncbi:DEAD/DEAH box helicase [Leptolyngbya sp. BC1307]|uniref:DEAD/DEAH box helicase n=1 Tax=Leptolyngbya sp. BC1307 TaxID=2029589 RepID=UPI000EFBFE8B|nr:DEAD/DEAH box helicase [Leptolyngbya sp. BC1307]